MGDYLLLLGAKSVLTLRQGLLWPTTRKMSPGRSVSAMLSRSSMHSYCLEHRTGPFPGYDPAESAYQSPTPTSVRQGRSRERKILARQQSIRCLTSTVDSTQNRFCSEPSVSKKILDLDVRCQNKLGKRYPKLGKDALNSCKFT